MNRAVPNKGVWIEVFHDHREFDTFMILREGSDPKTSVRIDQTYNIPFRDFRHLTQVWPAVEPDFSLLFRFVRQQGREVVISYDIAKQTIQYLKEAN